MDLEEWRALADFWIGEGKDPKYLNPPADVARQLNLRIPMEDTMTTETAEQDVAPSGQVPNDPNQNAGVAEQPKFKKKKYFPADKCGYAGCGHSSDGYVIGLKPTGKEGPDRLWYGPVCTPCVRKWHATLVPISLAELAYQRNGASDLALILDVEVGEVKRRLEMAGVDEKGVAIVPTPPAAEPVPTVETALGETPIWDQPVVVAPGPLPDEQHPTEVVTPEGSVALTVAAVTIPIAELETANADADGRLTLAQPYDIVDQGGMDWAAEQLAYVKGVWKRLDEGRKALGAPMRQRLKEIQDHYNPTLQRFAGLEGLLKAKMTEGSARLAAVQAQALLAAQSAYQANNPAAMAAATEAAVNADVVMPQGVTSRGVWKWRFVNAALIPLEMYDISTAKIDAAVAAGHRSIPGIEIYEEQQLGSRAS